MKNSLIIAILVFIIVACFALVVVLNKGYVGSFTFLSTASESDDSESSSDTEVIKPELVVTPESKYLSSSNKKKTVPLVVTMDDETITDGVTFTSSDEDIVKINDDNELVAVSNGKATITAEYDGLEATCEIKVITPITSMSFTTTNSTVRVGKDLQMKLQISPALADTDPLIYSSSDEEIATVNQNGIVTGVSAGTVTITVYDEYNDVEKSVKLTIKK